MNDKIIVEYSKSNLKKLCETFGCPSASRCRKGVKKLVKCHQGFGVRFRIWGPK